MNLPGVEEEKRQCWRRTLIRLKALRQLWPRQRQRDWKWQQMQDQSKGCLCSRCHFDVDCIETSQGDGRGTGTATDRHATCCMQCGDEWQLIKCEVAVKSLRVRENIKESRSQRAKWGRSLFFFQVPLRFPAVRQDQGQFGERVSCGQP